MDACTSHYCAFGGSMFCIVLNEQSWKYPDWPMSLIWVFSEIVWLSTTLKFLTVPADSCVSSSTLTCLSDRTVLGDDNTDSYVFLSFILNQLRNIHVLISWKQVSIAFIAFYILAVSLSNALYTWVLSAYEWNMIMMPWRCTLSPRSKTYNTNSRGVLG